MSVRKAAGLEPSGLVPPKLGEKVSREEVEAAKRQPITSLLPPTYGKSIFQSVMDNLDELNAARDVVAASFGLGSLSHQRTIISVDPATAGDDHPAFWIVNYGKPGSVPYVTIANDDTRPVRAVPSRNQVGRFTIYASDMQDVERMADLLDGVIVLEAQSLFYECASRYLGYHVGFDHVGDGDIAPTYDAIWSNGKRVWVRRAV